MHKDLDPTIAHAVEVIARPKVAPADSFVLHAPLELLARVGLLPLVEPARRADAIAMIGALAKQYAEAGESVSEPARPALDDPADDLLGAARQLAAAVQRGDVAEVDRLAFALLPEVTADQAVELLADAVIRSLAAAGHAPIGLALIRRVEPALPATLLHGVLRTIAQNPSWQLTWPASATGSGDPAGLHAAIMTTPHVGVSEGGMIYPIMSRIQEPGIAAAVLTPVLADQYDITATSAVLLRIAAWSMLHDSPGPARYGWSHTLTMPQGVMALAGAGVAPRTALAVAATFIVGFRAAFGTVALPAEIEPIPGPEVTWEQLATAACLHHDAHLVKYVLATHHAACDDPAYTGLYRAAAAHLVDDWGAMRGWSHA